MKRFATQVVLVLLVAVATVSCRTAPVFNVVNAPFTQPAPSLEDADSAIKRAGAALGWQMKTSEPGKILATLPIRSHVAIVDVTFNQKEFSIMYRDSTNLKYDGTEIHSNYNGWIQNLRNGIIAQSSLF